MKKDLHPTYYENAKITCACGQAFTAGSTEPEMRVEICSHCHPFFTGQQKLIDTAGRVEKFKARQSKTGEIAAKGIARSRTEKRIQKAATKKTAIDETKKEKPAKKRKVEKNA